MIRLVNFFIMSTVWEEPCCIKETLIRSLTRMIHNVADKWSRRNNLLVKNEHTVYKQLQFNTCKALNIHFVLFYFYGPVFDIVMHNNKVTGP